MKILLIGGASSLTNKLIIRLRKEKHKVFLITGQRNKNIFYEKVFERFDFPYEGENIFDIFRSVRPDLTIFMGAQDTNFDWGQVQQESARYNASLTNVLMSYASIESGRFLYLSSAEIYQGNYSDIITEDTPVENPDFYETTMKKAEELCQFYRTTKGLDVAALRLDRLWSVPQAGSEIQGLCAQMCVQAMQYGRIEFQENHSFTWLLDADAVEYIYRMINAKTWQYGLYQITSGNVITEQQLAEKISYVVTAAGDSATLVANDGPEKKTVLSNLFYGYEIGLGSFKGTDKVILQTVTAVRENKDYFLGEEALAKKSSAEGPIRKKLDWLLKALIPYIENLICFVPFFLLNRPVVTGEAFLRLDFFLLYVLLFALVHGQRQATVSALLATIGQIYLQSSMGAMVEYKTYIWIVQLFAVGLLVGNLHDRYYMLKDEMAEEEGYLKDKIADITEINYANVRVKESLETQIVHQTDGIGKIYNITSSLDRYHPEEVLFQAVDVLRQIINVTDVAIYTVGEEEYVRLYTATSDISRNLGNSVKVTDFGDIYNTLQEGKVYINRELKENYPMMATAVRDGGQLRAILMVWNIPWQMMTVNTANLLNVTTMLIQDAVLRAQKYLETLEEKRFSSQFGALEVEAFEGLLQVYENAQERKLTQYTLLKLEQPEMLQDGIGLELAKYLRQNDYVGMAEDEVLYILLTNTDRDNAQVVVDRLRANGYVTRIMEVQPT